MRFSIASAVTVLAGLTTSASAFVMTTYSDMHCKDTVQDVNVWDSTCATWPKGFKSFKITTWGGTHQRAYFFAPGNCGDLFTAIGKGYVDSTTKDFELGGCYNFDNTAINAIASYSA
ncbi:hypothetical protein BDV38DRAFT_245926 [Aspergillus pseudotamarii]|uniref:Small secreted protein n=1 Tax=Aspergillus pseudotamarii TaxID=132259 RepID=A0A5N6SXU9_ASPPS|nr:uncharacterized protein BDV38DRAFT_245926 [Aspergillus pseudotamarii]KAE8137944.1 hypothetical protein BDV38DRAFT_245926 [Aspergillus pseudotamarii]